MKVTKNNVLAISRALHRAAMANCNPPIALGSREEYLFLGLAEGGECGELQNEIKKVARDGMSSERMDKIAGEIADTYAYLLHVADVFSLDIQECFILKTDELVNVRKPAWARGAVDSVLADQTHMQEMRGDL
jgi:NTP pyrophosphatase (non-canonical NTP hydrolase)